MKRRYIVNKDTQAILEGKDPKVLLDAKSSRTGMTPDKGDRIVGVDFVGEVRKIDYMSDSPLVVIRWHSEHRLPVAIDMESFMGSFNWNSSKKFWDATDSPSMGIHLVRYRPGLN